MATRDQILADVRENLNDSGVIFWSSDDANDSIQDAYDDVAVRTQCIESSISLAAVSGLLYYNLYNLVTRFLAPKAIYDGTRKYWLEPRDLVFLKSQGNEWEKALGNPVYFCPISFEYTAFWPTYSGSAFNYTLIYTAAANTLASATVPSIPTQFQDILEDYTTADLLEQAQENQKALRYWLQYEEKVTKLKKYMTSRMDFDRFLVQGGGI